MRPVTYTAALFLIYLLLPSVLLAQQGISYKIMDTKTRKTISTEELVQQLKATDVLVFGEEHTDTAGHRLEADIFEKMLKLYPSAALSLEMFSTDVQPVLNEYLAGLISEKNFIKESRAWPNYKDYQPLVELAKLNHTTVIGANVAPRYSNAVSLGGLEKLNSFPTASKSFLPPLPVDTATGKYLKKFTETLGGHDMGGMKIYQTQNLWDAAMAWSVVKQTRLARRQKVFHINGRFHSDERLGMIAQLKKYAPKLKVASISCFSAKDFSAPDWEQYLALADYVIVTAAAK